MTHCMEGNIRKRHNRGTLSENEKFKAYRLPYVVRPQRLLGFLTVWFTQVCIRCILKFKNTSGHFHVSSILVFLSIGIELRWLMMTDNENTRTQDRTRTHIEKRPKAPSVKTVIIGYWWNRFGKGSSQWRSKSAPGPYAKNLYGPPKWYGLQLG